MKQETKGGKTVIDSVLELVDLITLYVKKQAKSIVDQSIAGPIGAAARKAAFMILAFSLFSLAAIFIAVGLFLSLVSLTGYILAYLIIGILLIIAGLITWHQVRR